MRSADAIKTCLVKSFVWKGRASRPEYWWFLPIGLAIPVACFSVLTWTAPHMLGAVKLCISAVALTPLAAVTARRLNDTGENGHDIMAPAGALIFVLFGLVVTSKFFSWVGLAAETIDGPGVIGLAILIFAFLLVFGLPLLVTFIFGLMTGSTLFGMMLLPSQPGPNKYGPNPYEVTQ